MHVPAALLKVYHGGHLNCSVLTFATVPPPACLPPKRQTCAAHRAVCTLAAGDSSRLLTHTPTQPNTEHDRPEFNRQPQPCCSPLETCGRPPGSSQPPGADGLLMPPSSLCLLYARHTRRSRPVCAGADESGDRSSILSGAGAHLPTYPKGLLPCSAEGRACRAR